MIQMCIRDRVSDEKQITALLSAVYQEVQREYPTESDLKSVRTLITCIKNMMLTDEEVRQLAAKLEEPINIAEIYQKYCRAMRENQWMDYDDQMIYAYRKMCIRDRYFFSRKPPACLRRRR